MASAAIQAFRRVVTVDWPKQIDVDTKALLLQVARDGHAEIMAGQGNPSFDAYANYPGNANLDSVVLPGPIVYKYGNLRAIVEVALDELRKASPVISGDYARSHTIYVNGVPVETLPADIKPSDHIYIANPIVYARRIEIGKTKSGRDFVMQVPNRIYERVAKQKLIPRYRNVAKITFGYLNLPGAYKTRAGLSSHYGIGGGKSRKRRQVAGTSVQAPAIIIAPLG